MTVEYTPESLVKQAAYDVGFSEVGIAGLTPSLRSDAAFDRWIERDMHGDMRYLSGGADKRHNPAMLLEGAKSVICVAVNYYSRRRDEANERRRQSLDGRISTYAQGRDYHLVLTEMLRKLDASLKAFFNGMQSVICVDTEPISERDLAVQSGIAWLGKNTCVISQEYGSWIFLGELITTLELRADEPLESLCGSCTRCQDACPTGALGEAWVLDATRCISYFTIEKRGEIPDAFHSGIGDNLFGCDECQRVCPFNDASARESLVFARDTDNPLLDIPLEALARIGDEDFKALTRESAIGRCKPAGMRRNARIVMANLKRS